MRPRHICFITVIFYRAGQLAVAAGRLDMLADQRPESELKGAVVLIRDNKGMADNYEFELI